MCDVLSTTIVTPTDSIVGQSEVTRGINGIFFMRIATSPLLLRWRFFTMQFETERVGIRPVCLANESN